jgi:hypothetical protein
MVTNQKTGVVLGYFVSAIEFEEYLKVRDLLPKALAGKEHTAGVSDRISDRGLGGLSNWYSWMDSNHRPPDPQSAVIARHDPTNSVTCPPRTPAIPRLLPSCRELSATRPDTTRRKVGVTPALPQFGQFRANHHFSLPICQVVEVPMARALSVISVRDPGCG